MSVVLAEAVERAVTTAFTKLNGQVEAAIALEVDRRLEQLAVELLAERVDATESSRRRDDSSRRREESSRRRDDLTKSKSSRRRDDSMTPKTCRVCGEEKPADQYEARRRVCRQCRRRQERNRAHQHRAAAEGDRPAADGVQAG